MFNKIATFAKKNYDLEFVILNGIIGASAALAFYYYGKYKLSAEMFNQVDKSIEALGLTEIVVNHMQTHVYPKL